VLSINGEKDSNLQISFSGNKPILKGNLLDSKSLIGTQFSDDSGKVWSWEIKDGNTNPNIYSRNILLLSSEKDILYKYNLQKSLVFIDPGTGESLEKQPSSDTFAKRLLSLPLNTINYATKEKTLFLEGELPHSYNVESRTFRDPETFFSALSQESSSGEKFNRLVIHSHGDSDEFNSYNSITIETLKNIQPSTLEAIRNGFSSSATCTAVSCLIFLNSVPISERVNYEGGRYYNKGSDVVFGSKLAEFFGMPIVGSVPVVRDQMGGIILENLYDFYSQKWVVAYPIKDEKGNVIDVKIDTNPPKFKIINIILDKLG
jgi:hypothetical protein